MKRAGLVAITTLALSPLAFAEPASLTPGGWTHTRATAVRGAPNIETTEVCITAEAAETSLEALATAFNESLFCEAQNLSATETGVSFNMQCGPISMYVSGSGEVTQQSAEQFTITAEARLNVPGSARIISTITETAELTGECSQ